MPLPDEQRTKIATWLNGKIKTACPACGSPQRDVGRDLHMLGTFHPESKATDPANGLPCAAVVCTNCGYISLHAAGLIGGLY